MSRMVLLIEDSEDNRGIIRQLIEDFFEDVTLLEAVNGLEGLQLARESTPDVILLDLSLPLMNGWEVAAALKGDPKTAHFPIVALTAHAMAGDEAKARAAGCDAYITKPLDMRSFRDFLNKYLVSVSAG